MRKLHKKYFAGLAMSFLPFWVLAQTVKIEDVRARSTVAGQQAGGVFAKITSDQAVSLMSASSPAAARVEIHEMTMDKGVMKMRPLPKLDLPAATTVELKPGGLHLMLIGLKQPLAASATVPMTLNFQGAQGKRFSQDVSIQVVPVAAGHHAH